MSWFMRTLVLLCSLLAAGTATATAEPTRSGLQLGLSMGGGAATACRDCDRSAGLSLELHGGAWLTPRFAVGGEVWASVGPADIDNAVGQALMLATATTRVGERWWIKGGAGVARYFQQHALEDELLAMDTSIEYVGLGVGGGVGYELHQSKGAFVVDVSARVAGMAFPGHGVGGMSALGLGVTWN